MQRVMQPAAGRTGGDSGRKSERPKLLLLCPTARCERAGEEGGLGTGTLPSQMLRQGCCCTRDVAPKSGPQLLCPAALSLSLSFSGSSCVSGSGSCALSARSPLIPLHKLAFSFVACNGPYIQATRPSSRTRLPAREKPSGIDAD